MVALIHIYRPVKFWLRNLSVADTIYDVAKLGAAIYCTEPEFLNF
jgi:hypothetical protein